MAKKYRFDWTNLIPAYGVYRSFKNAIDNVKTNGYQFGDIFKGWYGVQQLKDTSATSDEFLDSQAMSIVGQVQDTARQEYLEDRKHTEAREDSAYQRGVVDMQKAGLNPYTIGAQPAQSTASTSSANTIMSQLQILGYLLELKNINVTNKGIANRLITGILGAVASAL